MLLETKNVCRHYERNGEQFCAVKNATLCVHQGDFMCIQGPSGSGKSTLLSMLAGLLRPTSGSILFEGKDITRLKDKQLSLLRCTDIAYIPQGYSLLENLTVYENIHLALSLSGKEITEGRTEEMLLRFSISNLAHTMPTMLSGGEKRRVAIARALCVQPKILLADEPTNDLDAQNRTEVLNTFRSIAESGTAVLMVTHDEATKAYAHCTYTMKDGLLEPA